ncbi:hypothetical protein ACEQ8H_005636 [Pleosporales sp. CAS-2024a]
MDYHHGEPNTPAVRHARRRKPSEEPTDDHVSGTGHFPEAPSSGHDPATSSFGAFGAYHPSTARAGAGLRQPPTPPRQEDDIQRLVTWHAQQYAHQGAPTGNVTEQRTPYRHGALLPQEWDSLGHARLPSYHVSPRVDYQTQLQQPHTQSYYTSPSYHRRSPIAPAPFGGLPSLLPPIQQWPTSSLGKITPPTPPYQPARTGTRTLSDTGAASPSPGHDGITPPDKKTIRKQRQFQKKAEQSRRGRKQSMADPIAPQSGDSVRRGAKRKRSVLVAHSPDCSPLSVPAGSIPGHGQLPTSNSNRLDHGSEYARHHQPVPSQQCGARAVDWDALPQRISSEYDDYKWSVTLYETDSKSRYDFAQTWLEALFAGSEVGCAGYKWHAHSTRGFIQDGGRLSFIALHNAVNPFEPVPHATSTSSIAVYGRFWHDHDEMHWTTFAPGIRALLEYCEKQGGIRVKHVWKWDDASAAERRFHRAYWLAASMLPVKDLLNHRGRMDQVHDAGDEALEEAFEASEDDLHGGDEWDNTLAESEEAWQDIMDKVADIDVAFGGIPTFTHVVTGHSEWFI